MSSDKNKNIKAEDLANVGKGESGSFDKDKIDVFGSGEKPKTLSVDMGEGSSESAPVETEKAGISVKDKDRVEHMTLPSGLPADVAQKLGVERKKADSKPIFQQNVAVIGQDVDGYNSTPYSKKNLIKGGAFYPETWEFYLNPLTGDQMEYFSSVNEEDVHDIRRKQDYVIEKGVTILNSSRKPVSWRNIHEHDRFHLFLAIRDNTFLDGKLDYEITWEKTCKKGHVNTLKIDKNNLTYSGCESKIFSCWSPEKRLFMLNGADNPFLGKDAFEGEIRYIYSTLGHAENWYKFLVWLNRKGRESKEKYRLLFSTLFTKDVIGEDQKDWDELFSKFIDDAEKLTRKKTFADLLLGFIKLAHIQLNPTIRQSCSTAGCDSEVSDVIDFHRELKDLFNTQMSALDKLRG